MKKEDNKITDTWGDVDVTWFNRDNIDVKNLDLPFTQVYGICFNEKGEILVMNDEKYTLPGGTPESRESPVDALVREILEEMDVTIKDPEFLGAQLVEYKKGIDKRHKLSKYYQLRFIAYIDEILEQTPDPDNGRIYERKFVPANKITEYVQWGKIGEQMFKEAIDLRNSLITLSRRTS